MRVASGRPLKGGAKIFKIFRFFPLARSRAPQKLPKKEFELSERSEFSNSRQIRGAQGSPKDQLTRVPFLLVRFLWASKENEHKTFRRTSRTYPGPPPEVVGFVKTNFQLVLKYTVKLNRLNIFIQVCSLKRVDTTKYTVSTGVPHTIV